MAAKIKEFITCYDSTSQKKSQSVFCPICKKIEEYELKSVPEIQTLVIECSDCLEKSRLKK